MKVSIDWLKELVELKVPMEEVVHLLPLRTVGTKKVTEDFIELDMKGYNRADLLSMRGVAREVAAVTGSRLLFSAQKPTEYCWEGRNLPGTPVKIENENLSFVQCVAKIEGLKFDKSPADWVKKLNDSGMRTVNNIADITNLVMLEYGQPLHSFDADTVKNNLIEVRLAKDREEIKTLDNKLRKLNSEDIVLADSEKALDVAGVMGGKDTEVKEATTTILLSASMFNPAMVKKTSKRLGLYSEASKRFLHGLTKTNLLQALSAAIKMYEGLGGNLTAITLAGNLKDEIKTIKLTQEKVNSLIGIEIPSEEVESSLNKLGFKLASHSSSGNVDWEVTVPYFRLDIDIEEDLIEEVARMYGYEKIPTKPLEGATPQKIDQTLFNLLYNLKTKLVDLGLTEVQTYSFYSTPVLNNLNKDREQLVKIANPISSETEYLRDEVWPNLLEKAAENLKYFKEVAVFEIGKAYQAKPKLKEEYRLSMLLSDSSDNPIQELYQIFQGVSTHLRGVKAHLGGEKPGENKYFHPTRFAALEKDEKQVGWIAEIHPRIANKFGIEKRVAVLEIKL